MTKLIRGGMSAATAKLALDGLREYVVDFDYVLAAGAAEMYPATSAKGLSLGDRACLTLAIASDGTA